MSRNIAAGAHCCTPSLPGWHGQVPARRDAAMRLDDLAGGVQRAGIPLRRAWATHPPETTGRQAGCGARPVPSMDVQRTTGKVGLAPSGWLKRRARATIRPCKEQYEF
jgi:hypothetical protein